MFDDFLHQLVSGSLILVTCICYANAEKELMLQMGRFLWFCQQGYFWVRMAHCIAKITVFCSQIKFENGL